MSEVPLFEPTTVPRHSVVSPPLSDLEFERFCFKNDSVQIERTKGGVIELGPPEVGLRGALTLKSVISFPPGGPRTIKDVRSVQTSGSFCSMGRC
jgi:hypothetical protein